MDLKDWTLGGPIPQTLFLPHLRWRKINSVFNLSPEVPLKQGLENLADAYRQDISPSSIMRLLHIVFEHEVMTLSDGTFAVIPSTHPNIYPLSGFHRSNLFHPKKPGEVEWSQADLSEGISILQELDLDMTEFLDHIRRQTLETHAVLWEEVHKGASGLAAFLPFQRLLQDFELAWHEHLVSCLENVRVEGAVLHYPSRFPNINHRFACWRNGKLQKARNLPSGELEHVRSLVGDVQNDLEGFDLSLVVAFLRGMQPVQSPVSHWTFQSKKGWTPLRPPHNEAQKLWDSIFSSTLRWPNLEVAWKEGLKEKLVESAGLLPYKYQCKNLQRLLDFKPKHDTTRDYLNGILAPILP